MPWMVIWGIAPYCTKGVVGEGRYDIGGTWKPLAKVEITDVVERPACDIYCDEWGTSVWDCRLERLKGPADPVADWIRDALPFPLPFVWVFFMWLNTGCSEPAEVVSAVKSFPFLDHNRMAACNCATGWSLINGIWIWSQTKLGIAASMCW